MMKEEFEKLAGYEVSFEDYSKIIEPMYLATDLSKPEFVKCVSKKRFAVKPKSWYITEMQKIAAQIKSTCDHYTDYEKIEKLKDLVYQYIKRHNLEDCTDYVINNGLTVCRCSYPKSVTIYGKSNYRTIENINLF